MKRVKFVMGVFAMSTLVASGCAKSSGRTESSPLGPSAAPVDVQPAERTSAAPPEVLGEFPTETFALISVANPGRTLQSLQTFVQNVDAAAGAAMGMALTQLGGVDLSRPLDVLVLDPQKFSPPVVWVASVKDSNAIEPLLVSMGMTHEMVGERMLVGTPDVRAHVRSWVEHRLAGRATPEVLTVDFDESFIGTKYREYKPRMLESMKAAKPSAPAFMDLMVGLVDTIMEQVDDAQIAFEFEETRVDVRMSMVATPESTAAMLIADQESIEAPFSLLTRADATRSAMLAGGGSYRLDRSRAAVSEWATDLLGKVTTLPRPEAERIAAMWLELLGGPMVMTGRMDGLQMKGVYAFQVEDGARAKVVIHELNSIIYGGSWAVPGVMAYDGKGCTTRKRSGLALLSCTGRIVLDPSLEVPKEAASQDLRVLTAVDGDVVYLSTGDEKGLFELRRKLSRSTSRPVDDPRVEMAAARGETFYARYDFAALIASALVSVGKPLAPGDPANVEYAIGARDGRFWFRFGVGAQDLRTLKARFGGIAPGSPG